jgi:hypothetical protein
MPRALPLALALVLPLSASAATLRVPADHPTIQAAVDAAGPGDVIDVAKGSYAEVPQVGHMGRESPSSRSIIGTYESTSGNHGIRPRVRNVSTSAPRFSSASAARTSGVPPGARLEVLPRWGHSGVTSSQTDLIGRDLQRSKPAKLRSYRGFRLLRCPSENAGVASSTLA